MPLEGKKKQETSNPFESKRVHAPMVRGEKSGVLTGYETILWFRLCRKFSLTGYRR